VRTRATEMFGLELPVFAFSHCRDVVAAVSKAGGLGVLGALAFSPEQLEIELNWIDEHVDGSRTASTSSCRPATPVRAESWIPSGWSNSSLT
jgi:NAD(P)H-dependent flavin oxidoreductase YrpB (nitropropane dioxygenase family)